MAPIRLLVVDDHPVFRQGLRDVLSTDSEIVVVGEAADGKEALEQAYALQPDVILMDINLPGNSGLQATSQLQERLPEARVIVITGYDEPEQIYHSLRAGATAFCSKDMPPESLIRTVHAVNEGKIVIQRQILNEQEAEEWIQRRDARFGKRLSDNDNAAESLLTPREMEILEMICRGASNKDISSELGISYQTVKNHVTAILHKLGVKDRTQAVLYAIKREWFDIE